MLAMRILAWAAVVGVTVTSPIARAEEKSGLDALRAEMVRMQKEHQRSLRALEDRVLRAEDVARNAEARVSAAHAGDGPAPDVAAGSSRTLANTFNPSIGVVLDGRYRAFSRSPSDPGIPGFALDGEAGPGSEGISLGETEIQFDASIDDKFRGSLTLALADEDGATEAELENAFIETSALADGLTLRGGRFFSGIGYLNAHHAHTDNFTDRPLMYRTFLGGQLADDGVQARWVAPTDLFIEFGGELLRGKGFPGNASESSGTGAWSLYAHVAGDVGTDHSWRTGLSYLTADGRGRSTGDGDLFSGTADVTLVDAIYKWAPNGNSTERNLTLQAEVARFDEDGRFTPMGGSATNLDRHSYGFYAQGVYQFCRGWRAGLRYGQLQTESLGAAYSGTTLDRMSHRPEQWSAMMDWTNSEFGRIRLQYSLDESAPRSNSRITAQYVMSFGAHAAHKY